MSNDEIITSDEDISQEDTEETDVSDEEISGGSYDEDSVSAAVRQKRYRAPLIIAACVFLAVLIFFSVWKLFFDSSINGTWRLEITIPDDEKKLVYNFTFENNKTFRYQSEGQAEIGRYTVDNDKLTLYLSDQVYQFGYSVEGNAFSGRTLLLKDLDGFYFSPDTKDSNEELVEFRKKITDSVTEKGVSYYTWKLIPSEESFNVKVADDFKEDKQLTGIWFYDNSDEVNRYTVVFNSDGSFVQRNYCSEIRGSYTLSDGKCSISYIDISGDEVGTEDENGIEYSVKDNKLVFGKHEMTRTNDVYAYEGKSNK